MPDATITMNQIVMGLIILFLVAVASIAVRHWFRAWHLSMQAWRSGYRANIQELLLLQLRGADIIQLVNTGILAKREGVDVSIDQLAHHQLACGNVRLVVSAMLSAKRYNFPLSFERSAAIDLMGRDPVSLVAEAVWEANQIRIPVASSPSGIVTDSLPPITPQNAINSAAVLLQAAPGMIGVVIDVPRVHAQVRFPQGDLQVLVHSVQVPRPGDRLAIARVDGMQVFMAPAAETPAAAPAGTVPAPQPLAANAAST